MASRDGIFGWDGRYTPGEQQRFTFKTVLEYRSVSIVGFFLIITGVVMNIQVLRRPRAAGGTAAQTMGSAPWLMSVAIIAIGVLLLSIRV